MLAFFLGFLLAVCQVFLLKFLIKLSSSNQGGRAFWIFVLKFLIYGGTVALLMFKYPSRIEMLLYGFISGLPITAVSLFLYSIFSDNIKQFIYIILKKIKKP